MSDSTTHAGIAIALGFVGLAVIAVLVSSSANTTGVFTAGGGALQRILCAALAPVGGGGCATNVSHTITF